ncbi:MAG: cell division protein ZapA [Desulfovibrionaceae bacterium]|nr:cell division protein ZapA [Desulfovibrionaceae bacterium]
MPEYNLNVLGMDLSFRAEASPDQVEQARLLLENRFEKLRQHGRLFSKEKLLTFLALGLADDLVQAKSQLREYNSRIQALLDNISDGTSVEEENRES